MIETTGDQVAVVSDRIVKRLETWIREEKLDSGRAPLSVFVGWAHYPEGARDARELARAADERLCEARSCALEAAA